MCSYLFGSSHPEAAIPVGSAGLLVTYQSEKAAGPAPSQSWACTQRTVARGGLGVGRPRRGTVALVRDVGVRLDRLRLGIAHGPSPHRRPPRASYVPAGALHHSWPSSHRHHASVQAHLRSRYTSSSGSIPDAGTGLVGRHGAGTRPQRGPDRGSRRRQPRRGHRVEAVVAGITPRRRIRIKLSLVEPQRWHRSARRSRRSRSPAPPPDPRSGPRRGGARSSP